MSKPVVFSVIASPAHPNLSAVLSGLGYQEMAFSSVRKAIAGLRKHRPVVVIADFLYAYANNYASNHISNLDSLLISFQKLPEPKPVFLFLAAQAELPHLAQLTAQYPGFCAAYDGVGLPAGAEEIRARLQRLLG
jgi:hypothetical protein